MNLVKPTLPLLLTLFLLTWCMVTALPPTRPTNTRPPPSKPNPQVLSAPLALQTIILIMPLFYSPMAPFPCIVSLPCRLTLVGC